MKTGDTIPASLYRGIETVGGKIIFMENGLTFLPHSLNFQADRTFISYNQISAVNKRNTLKIIPNGITVVTKDGSVTNFVVKNRDAIIAFLIHNANAATV